MSERRRVKVTDQGAPVQPAADAAEDGQEQAPESCDCPALDPEDWDEAESDWSDIAFVRTSTNAVMGVPVGYGGAREELEAKARAAGAEVPEGPMLLWGEGRFRRPLLLEVEGAPAGAKGIERPGGIAYSRLVSAPYGELRKVVDDTGLRAERRYGRKPDSTWLWYLTCRVCSRERDFETLVVAHYREKP